MLPPIAPRYRSSQTEALQSSGSGADLDSPDAPPLEQRRDISNSEPELSVLKRQPAQSAQSAQSIARSDDFQKSDLQVDSKQNASQNFDRRNPVPMSQGLNRSASSANAPSLPSSGAPQNGVPGGSAATEAAIGTPERHETHKLFVRGRLHRLVRAARDMPISTASVRGCARFQIFAGLQFSVRTNIAEGETLYRVQALLLKLRTCMTDRTHTTAATQQALSLARVKLPIKHFRKPRITVLQGLPTRCPEGSRARRYKWCPAKIFDSHCRRC